MLLPGLQRQFNSSLLFVFALGVLVAAGDVITQQFAEGRGTNHDFRRTARMGVVGLVIGPVLRSWYLTLERIVPGIAKTAGFKKMLLDQSLFAPVMICFFFSVSETLAGKRPDEIKEMLQERYVQTLITNYLARCTDSEFYICSYSAPCWFCPNCSNILECIPVMDG